MAAERTQRRRPRRVRAASGFCATAAQAWAGPSAPHLDIQDGIKRHAPSLEDALDNLGPGPGPPAHAHLDLAHHDGLRRARRKGLEAQVDQLAVVSAVVAISHGIAAAQRAGIGSGRGQRPAATGAVTPVHSPQGCRQRRWRRAPMAPRARCWTRAAPCPCPWNWSAPGAVPSRGPGTGPPRHKRPGTLSRRHHSHQAPPMLMLARCRCPCTGTGRR